MADETFNPDDHTVEEVDEYLATADDDERERVLAAEREGQGRVGIVGHDGADTGEAENAPQTRATTFAEAAKDAGSTGPGYIGVSPAREAAGGKPGKGLSQQNPEVMGRES